MSGQDVLVVILLLLAVGAYMLGRVDGSLRREALYRAQRERRERAEADELTRLRADVEALREQVEQARWRGVTLERSLAAARSQVERLRSQLRVAGRTERSGPGESRCRALAAAVDDLASDLLSEAERLEEELERHDPDSVDHARCHAAADTARDGAERLRAVLDSHPAPVDRSEDDRPPSRTPSGEPTEDVPDRDDMPAENLVDTDGTDEPVTEQVRMSVGAEGPSGPPGPAAG